jgi:hypothetical protein
VPSEESCMVSILSLAPLLFFFHGLGFPCQLTVLASLYFLYQQSEIFGGSGGLGLRKDLLSRTLEGLVTFSPGSLSLFSKRGMMVSFLRCSQRRWNMSRLMSG